MKYRNKFRIISLLYIISLLLNGCSKEKNSVESLPQQQLMPLTINNYWEYDYIWIQCGDTTSNKLKKTVIGDTLIQGNKFYTIDNMNGSFQYLNNGKDGLWSCDIYSKDSLFIYLAFKYPYVIGEVYTTIPGKWPKSFKVISENKLVVAPAGSFNCTQYRIDYDNSGNVYEYVYIAPGVGIVQSLLYSPDYCSQGTVIVKVSEMKLKKYYLN